MVNGKYKGWLKIAKSNALYNQAIFFIEDILKDKEKTGKQKFEEIKELMLEATELQE